MEVRAKKALGQHFLTDQRIAQAIVDALHGPCEAVDYLLTHFAGMQGRLLQADFLNLRLEKIFPERFSVIGNFPYNISSQIFFKILDYRERIPEVVCMIQKEVAERIAEGPGSKTYGILSVLLQAWYDIEYLFSVGSGCFAPPPKVESAVIRLTRNSRTSLGCDESLFKAVVKTAFGQRRKTLRNSLKPIILEKAERCGWDTSEFMGASSDAGADAPELELMLLEDDGRINRKKGKKARPDGHVEAPVSGLCTTAASSLATFLSDPVFERRPETLSVEDFIALTNFLDYPKK